MDSAPLGSVITRHSEVELLVLRRRLSYLTKVSQPSYNEAVSPQRPCATPGFY